ncbi:MBL fold metallo-hydrolase [Celeribacter marinus]|uniref:Metal-dependent hydrolase of the beta-lactamase superfamily I PhnP protein n=1 Tax=Celeribacter marinus TaxID=1397108 RepID=A0A0N7HIV7_9RHOB|nr:MBL fold metallo-hydrolase [Celeribacter marinus]ALI56293.1 Metal-dependent hydrolase of the beta-lactamase superfamily I PhnP protein [Celeribacter marinus]SFK83017.1 phosphoribosyl 1,2-cyclic phosphate phosphodiesterase [Celeribacter marinus]
MSLRFTILGCGSSGGVPRIGGLWGACDPSNPKNRRQRCSALVERTGPNGTTTVLIDTSPDMRAQLLQAEVARLDGVIYTHPHADHVHGLDDLRQVAFLMKDRIKVWADSETENDLISRFGYAFVQPHGSDYPPILDLHAIRGPVTIDGPGGPITLTPIPVQHGRITALGFRIGDLAYVPDVSDISEDSFALLAGLEHFVIDALRYTPHSSHAHVARTLEWIERLRPSRAIITNMHIDLDYETLDRETPDHVTPAYDGMTIAFGD